MNTDNSSGSAIWVDTSMHRATLCEMDGAIGPDASRVIRAPERTAEDDAYRARALLILALVEVSAIAAVAWLVFA